MPNRRHIVAHSLAWLGGVLVLLAVFSLYLQPDFLVLLANQIWLCF